MFALFPKLNYIVSLIKLLSKYMEIIMVELNQINTFLDNKHIAVIGAIAQSKIFFQNVLIKDLIKANYTVYPVNPEADKIQNIKAYKSIEQLQRSNSNFDNYKCTSYGFMQVLQLVINQGYKNIWIQKSSETPETENMIRNDINLITKQCIIMYVNNTNIFAS